MILFVPPRSCADFPIPGLFVTFPKSLWLCTVALAPVLGDEDVPIFGRWLLCLPRCAVAFRLTLRSCLISSAASMTSQTSHWGDERMQSRSDPATDPRLLAACTYCEYKTYVSHHDKKGPISQTLMRGPKGHIRAEG